jgi:chorismate-pyruvate lyase
MGKLKLRNDPIGKYMFNASRMARHKLQVTFIEQTSVVTNDFNELNRSSFS